jgi:hypothetical protein
MATEPPVRPRRFFIVTAEFPGLLFGVLRGEPVALRRVVGGRGAGRWGIALSLMALAGAAPPAALGLLLAAHAAFSIAGWRAIRARSGLGLREHQRLLLWACPLLLLCAALLRGLGSSAPALVALVVAHVRLDTLLARERALGPHAADPIGSC